MRLPHVTARCQTMLVIESGHMVTACCSESSTVATHKAESADHRVRPRVLQQHFGHSGAMPAASTVRSSNLMLALNDPSSRGEGPVVCTVIRTHTRSRNTCNVKSGRLPVHLGLDPAANRSGANASERAAVHACRLHSKCDYIAIATDGHAGA
jgi:hypothetical protein